MQTKLKTKTTILMLFLKANNRLINRVKITATITMKIMKTQRMQHLYQNQHQHQQLQYVIGNVFIVVRTMTELLLFAVDVLLIKIRLFIIINHHQNLYNLQDHEEDPQWSKNKNNNNNNHHLVLNH